MQDYRSLDTRNKKEEEKKKEIAQEIFNEEKNKSYRTSLRTVKEFISNRWLNPVSDDFYTNLVNVRIRIEMLRDHKFEQLDKYIRNDEETRMFLIYHTKEIKQEEGDWFIAYMNEIFKKYESDKYVYPQKQNIPQDILDKFSVFDPEPIILNDESEDISVFINPVSSWNLIDVVDIAWDEYRRAYGPGLAKMIESYDVINL